MASSRRVPHMGREAAAARESASLACPPLQRRWQHMSDHYAVHVAEPRPKNRGHWTDREHALFLEGLEEFGTDYARLARLVRVLQHRTVLYVHGVQVGGVAVCVCCVDRHSDGDTGAHALAEVLHQVEEAGMR